ncbi:MAG: DUF3592 domain-containing protein [Elusimicrobia bacterium]|nr:DUF3592 domain-containing protein [Elusimicrobiota bacterium]
MASQDQDNGRMKDRGGPPPAAPLSLAPPPRPVSAGLVLQQVFGGFLPQFGWLFLGFGMVFFWVFSVPETAVSLFRFAGELESTPGTVTACRATAMSEDDITVFAVKYSFETQGPGCRGTSYATGSCPVPGTAVTVEFPAGSPEHSRVQGLRSAPFGPLVLIVFLFPAVGLGFILAGLRSGILSGRLLSRGLPTQGSLVSKLPTSTKINDRTVYAMTFAFRDSFGVERSVTTRTHEPEVLEDESRENILYDPADPSRAVTVDSLPGRVRVGSSGSLEPAQPGRTLLVLAGPLAASALSAVLAWWRYLR